MRQHTVKTTNLISNRIDVETIAAIAEDVAEYPVAKLNLTTSKFDLVLLDPYVKPVAVPTIAIDFDIDADGAFHKITMDARVQFSAKSRVFEIRFEGIGSAIYTNIVYDALLKNYLYSYMVGLIESEPSIRVLKVLPMPKRLPTMKPVNDWEAPMQEQHYAAAFYDLNSVAPTKLDTGRIYPDSKYIVSKVFN